MGPLLKSSQEAGLEGMAKKRFPYQVTVEDFFEPADMLRNSFAQLIHCNEPNRIVIVPSVSYALANVAKNLEINAGENIVLINEQFPSNVYPWKRVADEKKAEIRFVSSPKSFQNRGKVWNESILETIDNQTRLVSMEQIDWADGTLFDLEAIRKRTREVGALLVIDGTQSVGAFPFDQNKIQADMLVCGAYKWLLGPYAIGLAYYGEYFDDGTPIEESWMNRLGSEQFSSLVNYVDQYQEGALRYEVGEHSKFIQIPMLLKSLEQIRDWGVSNIQQYCQNLNQDALGQLSDWGYHIEEEAFRSPHLVGVRIPEGVSLDRLKNSLDRENIIVSMRGDAIRLSFHLYIEKRDIEKLLNAFKAAL